MREIVVNSHGPSLGAQWSALRYLDAYHVATSDRAIRGLSELRIGQRCTQLRRAEAERVLRAQPFLSEATVVAQPLGDSTVRIVVETVDEFSVIASGAVSTRSPFVNGIAFGEGNLLGQAIRATGRWQHEEFLRDAYGASLTAYTVLGLPYMVTGDGVRRSLGSAWSLDALRPFVSDLQHVGWRGSGGFDRYYFSFSHPTLDGLALAGKRDFANIGMISRIGAPGKLMLLGLSVTNEREVFDGAPVRVTDGGITPDTSAALIGRYPDHRSSRVNMLVGVRDLRFVRVSGFDALRAPQDVGRGFQVGVGAGRSLSVLGSQDDDMFYSVDLYAGAGAPSSFVGLQALGEARRDYTRDRWDGVLGSARLAAYVHPAAAQTLIISAEYAGGSRQRSPFELRLGDPVAGVRGFRGSRAVGAARAVARAEERWFLRSIGKTADLGIAAFTDAGRVWAGDVPFGQTTSVQIGAGVSLLAAVPAGSKHLWRVDLAFPMTRDAGATFSMRLSSADLTRSAWHEPADVSRSRESFVPSSIFRWP